MNLITPNLERQMRKCFHDFLKGLLCLDPLSRRTPEQALQHPFLTGAELELPYNGDKLLPQRHSIPSGNVSVLSASLAKTSIKDELKSNPGAYAGISVGSGNYFNSAHTHTGAFSTSLGSHVVGLHGPVFSNLQKPLSHSGGHRSNNSGDYADQMRRSSSFIRIPINSDSQTSLDHVSVSIENSPSRLTSTYQHSLGSDSSNSHRKNIISKNITISKEVRSSPNDSEFYRRATLPNRAQQKQASQFQHAGSYSKHYVRSGFSHGHAQSFNRAAAFPSIWSPDVSDLSPSQPSFSEVISIPDHSPYNRNFMFFDRSVFPPPLANPSEWYGNGNSSSNSSGQPSNTTLIGADELTHDIEHNSVSEDSFTVNMESADAEWDPFFHSGTPHSLEPKSSVLAKASHSSGNGRHPSNQKR